MNLRAAITRAMPAATLTAETLTTAVLTPTIAFAGHRTWRPWPCGVLATTHPAHGGPAPGPDTHDSRGAAHSMFHRRVPVRHVVSPTNSGRGTSLS
jgi:hypothetical protein